MRLPELLHPDDRKLAYELIKICASEETFSLWVEMVNVMGIEKAFENIVKAYQILTGGAELDYKFAQLMYAGLIYHLEKQGQQN